jgi:hypothetical protein
MAAGLRKLRRASSRTDRPLGHPTQLPCGDLDRLVAYRRTISPNTATPAVKITNKQQERDLELEAGLDVRPYRFGAC